MNRWRPVDQSDGDALRELFGDRLVRVQSPLRACLADPNGPDCRAALADHRNPYFLEDEPGAVQTTGWLGAFTAEPSVFAVAAEASEDIAAAVGHARSRGLRLVIKGTGHDYLGRSCAAGSLLIWTHRMREVVVHDAFRPAGSDEPAVPAITVGAGTRWLEAYQALTPLGRYVQGGGCLSVGAAGGFVQGGGFGSLSKAFGTAAGNVLEMEVVTADGQILAASASRHPNLFWALRGGGGGTFGVVSKVTYRTHPAPQTFGLTAGTIRAASGDDYQRLIAEVVGFCPAVCGPHWGEQLRLRPDHILEVFMTFIDLTAEEAEAVWRPFLDWVDARPGAYSKQLSFAALPFGSMWDAGWWDRNAPATIVRDRRPGAPADRYFWATNQGEVSQYVHAYQSRWLPADLFHAAPDRLAEALYEASRHWGVGLHFNKGLAGAAMDAVSRDRTTSIHPAAFDAAALVIIASTQGLAFPGIPGHAPDQDAAAARAARVSEAMAPVRRLTPDAGAYVNEADYFEPDWQLSFWGANYPRLLEIKRRYDPDNMFCIHHGVGSENR